MFNIELRSDIPIYEQICNFVKESILKGYLKKGDPLPSVRKLASMLDINPNTVAKSYAELEKQGVIVTEKGKGTFISDYKDIDADFSKAMESIRPILTQLMLSGKGKEDIIKGIYKILEELEGQ